MIISHLNSLEKTKVAMEGAKGAEKQVAIGPEQGWKSHVMRVFTLESGGHTPRHRHDWPHINYIIKGKGVLFFEDSEKPIEAGTFAFVPPGTLHQYRNTGDDELSFICIVPKEGEG